MFAAEKLVQAFIRSRPEWPDAHSEALPLTWHLDSRRVFNS
jgi:hypothetical protein